MKSHNMVKTCFSKIGFRGIGLKIYFARNLNPILMKFVNVIVPYV